MKRLFTPVVCAALALTLAAGCGQTGSPASSAEEPQAQPLHLETLAVELPRDYAPDDETLLQAIANAPELLKAALAKEHRHRRRLRRCHLPSSHRRHSGSGLFVR